MKSKNGSAWRNFAKLLLVLALFAVVGCMASLMTGCTSTDTDITRSVTTKDGDVTTERTLTRARMLLDGKHKLSDFSAGQTRTTQKIGIGQQSGESTSEVVEKITEGIEAYGRLKANIAGAALPLVTTNKPTPK